jgi:hypothetical protein
VTRRRILLSIFVFSFFLMLSFSPLLFLKRVEFRGQTFVSESELTDFISPFYNKSSVLGVVALGMRQFILDRFVSIEDVRFQFVSPTFLRAHVTEKKAWVSFWVDGKSILVSNDGTILSYGDKDVYIDDNQYLLIIRGFSSAYFQDPILPQDLIQRIADIKSLTEHYFPSEVLQIERQGDEDWAILLHDTLPILIGEFDSLEDKFTRLSSFMAYYNGLDKQKTLKQIDLRIRDKIVVGYDKKF